MSTARHTDAVRFTEWLANEIVRSHRSLFSLSESEFERVQVVNLAYAQAWDDYVEVGGESRATALEDAGRAVLRARDIEVANHNGLPTLRRRA